MPVTRGKNLLRARELSFKSVWRELRAQGWTSRKAPARSLDDRYRYVRPGGDPKGEEGVDFFIGAEAVLEYYVNCPAPGPAPASVPAPALAATPVLEDAPAPAVTGSPMATPVAVSTTPPPVMPSPHSPQPSVDNPAAFTTPVRGKGKQRLRSSPARGRLIPTSPHEVIDLEAVSEEDDDEVDDDDGDEDFVDDDIVGSVSDAGTIESVDESFQPELSTRDVMSDRVDDLNLTAPDEDAKDFEVMESGDEAAKDDMFVDDDDADIFPGDVHEIGELVDDDDAEADVEHEFLFAERFLDDIGGVQEVLAGNLKKEVLKDMAKTGWEDVEQPDTHEYMQTPYEPVLNTSSYPGLRQGYSGASADALRRGESPLALFFYFMPVPLWQHIAMCTNEYRKEMIPQRVDEALRRYKKRRRAHASLPKKTRRDILHDLQNEKTILPHEICRFFGLLIARGIMPNREKLANHWKTTDEGGIPRGTFGAFLSRDRFQQISRNLHFNPNNHEQAKRDRAWKIRKLVDVLQTTFERGYVAPAYLAFDEAILPSRSSFNKMRMYLKDKPHKWGTKLFMLCSAVTAYCIRFEVYCGKKQHASDAHNPDMKSGPAAVVRNLLAVFGPGSNQRGMRLVVVDRFYTSVALAIQLLLMGFYCVGTIMTNRVGYCNEVIEKKKSRPKDIDRGTYKIAKSKLVPGMTAISWWDSRPVHFLSTGGSLELDRVARRDSSGNQHEVPCPRVIKDYHAYMGGVDVHDQLRLQRYSLQRAVRFQKYYKSLALGLIDMAIVNGYIIHKQFYKDKEGKPLSHVAYMKTLHLQLCQLQASDMYEGNEFGVQPVATAEQPQPLRSSNGESEHTVRQLQRFRNQTTQNKRYRYACKVCASLKEGKERAKTSTFYCSQCNKEGPIFLCLRAHRQIRGVAVRCWDIWHRNWKNGRLIPPERAGRIRMRVRGPQMPQDLSAGEQTPTPRKKRRTHTASE